MKEGKYKRVVKSPIELFDSVFVSWVISSMCALILIIGTSLITDEISLSIMIWTLAISGLSGIISTIAIYNITKEVYYEKVR